MIAPVPLALWPALHDRPDAASPLAFRPGVITGTEVSWYPLGYPVLMAAAQRLFGGLAPYLVAPVLAGLMVWCLYTIAARAGGQSAGLVAALLIAATPVTLGYAAQPMSDVPAAAMWALSWAVSFRRGQLAAIAAGTASAMAIMIRPQLAPLGIVPLLLLLGNGRLQLRLFDGAWRRGGIYVLSAILGPLVVAWSQAVLYGDYRTPGYPGWEGFFSVAHIAENVWLLPKQLIAVHTPLVVSGLVAAFFVKKYRATDALPVILSAGLLLALNYTLYLPYLPYDDVFFVRFMLPGLMALCVVNGVVFTSLGKWLAVRQPLLTGVAVVPVVIMFWHQAPAVRYAFTLHQGQSHLALMGRYVREVVPPNAVVFCALQSGGVAHYTGAEVLRFDLIEPGSLDGWVDRLKERGYEPVLVMDENYDQQSFRAHGITERPKYRWMPRAEFHSSSVLHYMVPVRRDRLDTDPGIVDVLR